MKRAVGYCENTECEDFLKGTFLLNHSETFYCPRCRQPGRFEAERGFCTGEAGVTVFREVRVEFNFDPDPERRVFREIAIVTDENLRGPSCVYTLQSPMIKKARRALKVAEAILANLNRYRDLLPDDAIPHTTEQILSWDEPYDDFSRKLQQLSKEWLRGSNLQA